MRRTTAAGRTRRQSCDPMSTHMCAADGRSARRTCGDRPARALRQRCIDYRFLIHHGTSSECGCTPRAQGSLTINDGMPSVGRDDITAAAEAFMDAFPDLTVILDDRLPVSIPSWVCEPNSVPGRRVRFTNAPVVAAHFSHEHACPIRSPPDSFQRPPSCVELLSASSTASAAVR
jgi:hypothetical protein